MWNVHAQKSYLFIIFSSITFYQYDKVQIILLMINRKCSNPSQLKLFLDANFIEFSYIESMKKRTQVIYKGSMHTYSIWSCGIVFKFYICKM